MLFQTECMEQLTFQIVCQCQETVAIHQKKHKTCHLISKYITTELGHFSPALQSSLEQLAKSEWIHVGHYGRKVFPNLVAQLSRAPLLRCIGWVSWSSQSHTEVFATHSTSFGCRELKLGDRWINEHERKWQEAKRSTHILQDLYTPCWSCELFDMQTAHLACSPRDQCLPTIQRKQLSWISNCDTFYYKVKDL